MKRVALFLFFAFVCLTLFSQDTTIVFPDPGQAPVRGDFTIIEYILSLIPWILDFIGAFTVILTMISVLIRRISTNVNLDPLFKIIKFLDDLGERFSWLRNRSSVGGRHIVTTILKKDDDK